MHLTQRLGHSPQPNIFPCADVCAGMEHQIRCPQDVTAFQFNDQRVTRFLPQRIVGRSEIQQIGRMSHDRFDPRLLGPFPKPKHIMLLQRVHFPGAIRLDEYLQGVTSHGLRPVECSIQSPGDGLMGTEP